MLALSLVFSSIIMSLLLLNSIRSFTVKNSLPRFVFRSRADWNGDSQGRSRSPRFDNSDRGADWNKDSSGRSKSPRFSSGDRGAEWNGGNSEGRSRSPRFDNSERGANRNTDFPDRSVRPRFNNGDRGGFGNRDNQQYGSSNRPSWSKYNTEDKPEPEYGRYDGDHLFGINSVRLALMSQRRTIKELIIQTGMDLSAKKDVKAANEILQIAQERGITVREFSKHDLNMMTDSKPHQGFVLRANPLDFVKLSQLERSDQFRLVF